MISENTEKKIIGKPEDIDQEIKDFSNFSTDPKIILSKEKVETFIFEYLAQIINKKKNLKLSNNLSNNDKKKLIFTDKVVMPFLDEYLKAAFTNYLYSFHKNRKEILEIYLTTIGFNIEDINNLFKSKDNNSELDYIDLNKFRPDFSLLYLIFYYDKCKDKKLKKKFQDEIIIFYLKPKLDSLLSYIDNNTNDSEDFKNEIVMTYLKFMINFDKDEKQDKISTLYKKFQTTYIKFFIKDLKRETFTQGITNVPKFYRKEKLLLVAKYLTNQVLIRLDNEGNLVNGKLEDSLKILHLEKLLEKLPIPNSKVSDYPKSLRDDLTNYLTENVVNVNPPEIKKLKEPEVTDIDESQESEDKDNVDKQNITVIEEKKENELLEKLQEVLVELGFDKSGINISETMLKHLTESEFSITTIDDPNNNNNELKLQSKQQLVDFSLISEIKGNKVKEIFNSFFVVDTPKYKDSIYKLSVFFMKYVIGNKQKDCALSLNIGNDSAVMSIDYKLNTDIVLITSPSLENFVFGLLSEYYLLLDRNMTLKEIRAELNKLIKGNNFTTKDLQQFANHFLDNNFKSDVFDLKKDNLKKFLDELKKDLIKLFGNFLKSNESGNKQSTSSQIQEIERDQYDLLKVNKPESKGDKINKLINELINSNLMINGSKYKSRENYYDYIFNSLSSIQAMNFLKILSFELSGSNEIREIVKVQEKVFSDFKASKERLIAILKEFPNFKGDIQAKVKEIIENRDNLNKILTKKIYEINFDDFSEFLTYSRNNLIKGISDSEELEHLIDFSQLFMSDDFDLNKLESLNIIFYFFINLIDSYVKFINTEKEVPFSAYLKTFSDFRDYKAFIDLQQSDSLIQRELKYSKFPNKIQERDFNHLNILEIR